MNMPLRDDMREYLEAKLVTTTSEWQRRRLLAVLLCGRGVSTEEIVVRLKCSRATLYRWWQQWEASGVDGLLMKQKVGRPISLAVGAQRMIEAWLESDPKVAGLLKRNWTVRLLCNALAKVDIPVYDDRVLRRFLKRHGWRYIGGRWRRDNQ